MKRVSIDDNITIKKEHEILKKLLECASNSVYIFDIHGNIFDCSKSFYEPLGYSYEEILNKNINAIDEKVDKEKINFLIKTLDDGSYSYETKYKKSDNTYIDVEVSCKLLVVNEEIYIYAFATDISKRMKLRSELDHLNLKIKEATKKLNHSLEVIEKNVICSMTDLNGVITEVTDKFCEISKYSREELIGKNHNIIRHPDMPKSVFKEIWKTITSGKTWSGRVKNKNKYGQPYWVDSTISPYYDIYNNHIGYYSYRIDVTQEVLNTQIIENHNQELEEKLQIQLEEIRQKDLKMLEQSKNASMADMLRNIAHQWRQPLNIISLCSSGVSISLEHGLSNKEEMIEQLRKVNYSCQHLTKTIETFSNYLNVNKNYSLCSIQNEIDSAKYLIETALKHNFIELIDEIDYLETDYCYMVENELSEVVINILNNAKDALVQNKDKKSKWIKITSKIDKDKFTLIIEDNAGGIPEEIKNKIFEPYFTTKFESQGTGLGLSMSYNIITNSIKGDLYVKNSENGAMFIIELPLSTNNLSPLNIPSKSELDNRL